MARKGRVRISLDIPEELHETLKEMCDKRYMTKTMYIIRALVEKFINEEKYK